VKILLVEDNPADVRLMVEGLRALSSKQELQIAGDGDQAIAELNEGKAPDLILLDINLPRRDGFEVRRAIRALPRTRITPVIVLSSSTNPDEIALAYKEGANAYVCKPFSNYFDMLGDLTRFWLKRAVLPVSKHQIGR